MSLSQCHLRPLRWGRRPGDYVASQGHVLELGICSACTMVYGHVQRTGRRDYQRTTARDCCAHFPCPCACVSSPAGPCGGPETEAQLVTLHGPAEPDPAVHAQQGEPEKQSGKVDGGRGPVEHLGLLVVRPRLGVRQAAAAEEHLATAGG